MKEIPSLQEMAARSLQVATDESDDLREAVSTLLNSTLYAKHGFMITERNQVSFINKVLNTVKFYDNESDSKMVMLICLSAMREELNLSKHILFEFFEAYETLSKYTYTGGGDTVHQMNSKLNPYNLLITRAPDGRIVIGRKNFDISKGEKADAHFFAAATAYSSGLIKKYAETIRIIYNAFPLDPIIDGNKKGTRFLGSTTTTRQK